MSTRDAVDDVQYVVKVRPPARVWRRSTSGEERRSSAAGIDAKRAMDIVGATIALVFFGPLMVLIYLVLFVACGGSPIFAHRRVGQGGSTFLCYKFRSMRKNAEEEMRRYLELNADAREEWGRCFKLRRDPRITPFGAFLRSTSLDELPQLFNVLKGEMSLVGPRPIVSGEIDLYGKRIADYCACRPGMTGLWQISGRNAVSYDERVRFDVLYARKRSVGFDVAILLRTIRVVLNRRGAC
jgi:lipopolysaccharide/colanic/teichoic acid biosynthesis glycosyltransferase